MVEEISCVSPKLDFGNLPTITIASPWKIRHREYQPDQTVQPDGCGLTSVASASLSRYDNISRSQFLLSSDALVPMVQPTDFPDLNDPASLEILNGSGFRGIFIQRQMRPRAMVITEVTFQNSTQVPLVDHDHVVQAFSANTSDNPFRVAVLPRTSRRYRNLLDTQSIDSRREVMTIDPFTISYQVARHCFLRKRFDDLLSSPSGCGVFRNIEMQNTATVMREDNEDIQYPKLYGRNREEVDRDHLANVISKKRHPGLRRLSRLHGHQARYGPLRNLTSQFFQFAVYSWCSPCRIGDCHTVDERPDLRTGSWTTRLFRLG